MRRRTQVAAAVMAVMASAGIVMSQSAGQDAPPPPDGGTVKGTVIGMNLNGDGEPNGLLIKTADGRPPSQVNFPPHMAAAIAKAAKVGATVTAETRPVPPRPDGPKGGPKKGPKGGPKDGPPDGPDGDRPAPPPADGPAGDRPTPPPPPPADHPVSELVSLTPDGGEAVPVTRPEDGPKVTAKGNVARLNYTREGRADGAVLDDGTLVHVGPKEAEDLKLAVGQTLDVEGTKPPKAADAKVIHATKVNGTTIERPRPMPKP